MFQFNQIPSNIQRKLFKRMNALSRSGEFKPMNPMSEQKVNALSEMLTKSCWVKVTAALPAFKTQDGKLVKPREKVSHQVFTLTQGFTSTANEDSTRTRRVSNKPITTKANLMNNDPESILRAGTGVTGISTQFKNHSIQNVTINWKLYDLDTFEMFEKAFLKHGRTVLVEFGWAIPEAITFTTSNASDMLGYYKDIEKKILQADGDYYAAIGTIKSFNYNVGQNGEFDCTTELTSMGNTLFKGQVEPSTDTIPDLVKNENAKTEEEAFIKSQLVFEKYLVGLNKHLKSFHDKGNVDVFFNEDDEKAYCTWGWFEDNILNTFFGFVTKKKNQDGEDDDEILTTKIRSIASNYNVKGPDGQEILEEVKGENLCRYTNNLFTKSSDIIFPGQIIGINSIKDARDGVIPFDEEVAKKYGILYKTFTGINDTNRFKPFKINEERGSIRRIVFSADFIIQQFSGIRDLESGLTNFWSTVTNRFGGYWNFSTIQDPQDNGKIGVVDDHVTVNRIKDINPKLESGNKSTPENPNGTFVFPLYSSRSLFKDFSLQVKLSSAMATQAMFHSNKNYPTQGEGGTGKPEDIGVTALATMQNTTITDKTGDKKLTEEQKDLLLDEIYLPYQGNPNNNKGPEITIRTDPNDSNSELETTLVDSNVNLPGLSDAKEKQEDAEQRIADEENAPKDEGLNWFDTTKNPQDLGLIYTADGNMLRSFSSAMDYLMNRAGKSNIDIDPVTPLEISFTMPGIGGIRMYDLFAVDYLPEVYRDYTLFQVSGVSHTLSTTGWDTQITGIARVDMESLIEAAEDSIVFKEDKTKIVTKSSEQNNITFLQFQQNAKKDDKPEDNSAQ